MKTGYKVAVGVGAVGAVALGLYLAKDLIFPPVDGNGCVDTTWTPSASTVCSGIPFTQTSNCGTTKSAVGVKTTGACAPPDGDDGNGDTDPGVNNYIDYVSQDFGFPTYWRFWFIYYDQVANKLTNSTQFSYKNYARTWLTMAKEDGRITQTQYDEGLYLLDTKSTFPE